MAARQPTATSPQRQLFADPERPILSTPQQEIVESQLAAVAEEVERFSNLRFSELPSVLIDAIPFDNCPFANNAIYFLTHPTYGILYVGKANNLRGRWRCDWNYGALEWMPTHKQHQRALDLGGVYLSWTECKNPDVIEAILIKALQPPWNIRGK